MESNLLMGGMKELGALKGKVIELNNCIEEKETLEELENELEKSIEKNENEISDEITKVTRQRRAQMEDTFDEQINIVNEKLKKVQSRKEKTKKSAINDRIDKQTADYKSEEEELKIEGKAILKEEYIPYIYNNRLFFALYLPKGVVDYGIILLSLIIVLLAIPFGAYYGLFNGMSAIYLALCYICSIAIFGGIYLVLGKTKNKHREALDRVRGIRKKIQESIRQQRRIKRKIRNDKDESSYSLDEFDTEIENLQLSITEIIEQKKIALLDFDYVTSPSLKDEIISSHDAALSSLKGEYHKVYEQNKEKLERLNKLSLSMSVEYEGYLGKDNLTVEKIEQMEETMKNGNAKTISEAIAAVSQRE